MLSYDTQNWFQNRRAKSKQDAKKQAGAFNLFAQQSANSSNVNFSSDSDASPAFTSSDYFAMMQQCNTDEQMSTGVGMGISGLSQFDQKINGLPFANPGDQLSGTRNGVIDTQQHIQQPMYDSPQEINRRTLTQEQFDAFAQDGNMMQDASQFDSTQHDFPGSDDVLQQVFPEINHNILKSSTDFDFSASMAAPLSSCDSSIPSTISEQSMFPSSAIMQNHANISTESLDWPDSRSSSVSLPPHPSHTYQQMTPHAQQQPAPRTSQTSQWQPGQSIPVDPSAMQQQFEDAQRQARLQVPQEQPMSWPGDDAFVRRDSQNGTMLAQQMSAFAIQTPQPPQTASFKCPPPPQPSAGSIAARRQKQRPANIGLAALRSQSYSGPPQPGSPPQQPVSLPPGQQQLRRIRSSNVLGGIAQGRVMKSTPGSAQRSPMSFSFAEAMSSPRIARHASTSDLLAPPTPHSPREMNAAHSRPQFPSWQSSSGQFSRQASISETDVEHDITNQGQTFTSPPRTPMHPRQQQVQSQPSQQHNPNQYLRRVGSNVITENTPPQSAPASQQTFPNHAFMAPPPLHSQPQPYTPPQAQPAQVQQFVSAASPDSSFQAHMGSLPPPQQYILPSVAAPPQDTMQFDGGVPMVDAQGQLTMAYPAAPVQQMQFVQHVPPQSQHQSPPQHINTPPHGGQYSFVTSDSGHPPGMHVTSGLPKTPSQPAEFFVHEYNPPSDLKNAAAPRRPPIDTAPKNYTFTNHGPVSTCQRIAARTLC
jgi:hypothetical protein